MPATRRRFLGWMGTALAAGSVVWWWRGESLRRWLVAPGLAPDPPGPLRDSTAQVLGAAVLALLDERVELAHYVEFFRWRAANVPGARALYERFENSVDRAARAEGAPGFRSAGRAGQRRIVQGLLPARGARRLRRVIVDRDEARFSRHIVREIFRLFARTDAWTLSGYDAWPGIPRAIAPWRGRNPRT